MESDIHPNASFKGKINDWHEIDLTNKVRSIALEGTMTIHGVSKVISEKGNISIDNGNISGDANFQIKVADYDVKIPKILRENIAKVIDVNIQLVLKKK
jgi:polyisoprenoid-binding protein YceI